MELIREEIQETLQAMLDNDLIEIADGIVDSIVVLIGAAVTYGIDIRPIWSIIHKTNMAKKGGKIREDGKQLKPEDWQPPDVAGEIGRQVVEN
jgi:predicted HAD superfamily Cof-like phosphohydrolase